MNAIDIDHAGVAGRDLDLLAAAFERLGFKLTPRARHSGRRKPDGPVEPFGTANRCIMLRQGYLELIAIVDPSCYSNGLERFLAGIRGCISSPSRLATSWRTCGVCGKQA